MSNSTVKESLTVQALKLALEALEAAYARLVTKCEQNLVTYNGVDVDTLTLSQEAIAAIKEALRLADAMEYDLDWCDEAAAELRRMHDLLGKANALCRIRAEEIERLKAQPEQSTECGEPVAFPRQAGKSIWTVDTAFIWRVKHTIDPDTPNDFTPSEEQIETVLLALEKIPSKLYTTPPQRTWVGLTDEEVDECYYWKDRLWTTDELVRHVEAKLKEKNT